MCSPSTSSTTAKLAGRGSHRWWMGPNYACLFLGCMLSTYTGFIPELYKQHIDDIVRAAWCCQDVMEDFITHVSTFHSAFQLTHFLDITLSISGSRVSTSVHYKDTDIHNYLHYTSSHPKHCKNGIPYSQLPSCMLRISHFYVYGITTIPSCILGISHS